MDFSNMIKNAMGNVLDKIKAQLLPYLLAILGIILFLIIIIAIIATLLGYEAENSNGTYNGLSSYSFWWPIGSQEITTDEEGNEYAVGDPSAIDISSDYKDRNPERPDHNGIDIWSLDTEGVVHSQKQGSEPYHYIIAAKGGTVTVSHLSDTAGEYVVIDHGNGLVTKYMHMHTDTRRVNVGDTVKQGQILGMMGTTGSSTDTHLHFQIELNGEPVDPLQYVSAEHPRGGGLVDIYSPTLSKEEFVECALNYRQGDNNYQNNLAIYASDFYDVCTEYGVNPELAFAWSCWETGYGSSQQAKEKYNYFGMGAYNENPDAATTYSSPRESIEAYCKWVKDATTSGTSLYQFCVERAEELAPYNSLLVGTPDTNPYVLYCIYGQLDATHEANPDGSVKYLGTHYITQAMYGQMCNHPIGSETTGQEKADYAVWDLDVRLEILQNIFGK